MLSMPTKNLNQSIILFNCKASRLSGNKINTLPTFIWAEIEIKTSVYHNAQSNEKGCQQCRAKKSGYQRKCKIFFCVDSENSIPLRTWRAFQTVRERVKPWNRVFCLRGGWVGRGPRLVSDFIQL